MIITENLTKRFDEFLAVDRVSLNIGAGQVLALLGPNGAGKTTTVRMLTSVLQPSQGWARVANYDIVNQAPQVRASVGVLTEHHGLYNRMPATEYLDFFGEIYHLPRDIRKKNIQSLLDKFGMQEYARRPIGEYSKGMRQKLALARALLHNPPVLLLDEPTSAMDPESARLVRDSIRQLRSAERTIVICTHNLAEAEELADQIAIIRRGRVIALGSPQSLKDQLLGLPEYEVKLTAALENYLITPPKGTTLTTRGADWIRFRSDDPAQANPVILKILLDQGAPVLSISEAPRSLEQVYLQAINTSDEAEAPHAQ
jgi:ABC-2 type transport system ATP-binding protein